jgi:hypothetical protein
MHSKIVPVRYSKVPPSRRIAALAIDLLAVGIISSAVGSIWIAQAVIFVGAWLLMRVVLVAKNHGQSLGRWALNMTVIDTRDGKIPELQELSKREGLLSLAAFLAFLGLVNLNPASPWSPLLFVPLLIDCGAAFTDEATQQAFHDRLAGTMVVESRRGYSLDVKVKRLVAQARSRMR